MSNDRVAAYLEDVLARNSAFGEGAADVPRLLAALNRALKLAASWEQFAAKGDAQAECAHDLREAIAEELLREEER